MFYPLLFKPIFQERIWGGRALETLYGKPLPPSKPIGESWEIVDREDANSEIINGEFAGKTLGELMREHERDLLGYASAVNGRFPLLVKILDAREKLSLQVHPPPDKAAQLKGEPKTEMWYITDATPGSELYVGLKKGVDRAYFAKKIEEGTVADCFHRQPVSAGDAMFLPSGRVHAIGAGLVLFEIQQNSDTTYRVFDWNRVDSSGKARPLHVRESLECVDFADYEPPLVIRDHSNGSAVKIEPLVEDTLFKVEAVKMRPGAHLDLSLSAPKIAGVISGSVRIEHSRHPVELRPGQFSLLPAAMRRAKLEALDACELLLAQPGVDSAKAA